MELPKYHETFNPILEVLADGKAIHYNELRQKVRDQYYSNLPQDLLTQTTSTGANVLLDRIGWAKSYLKQGNFVAYPQRALVQITEKGKQVIKKGGITLQELKKDPDYLEHKIDMKNKKGLEKVETSIDSASPQDLIVSRTPFVKMTF